jgi:hypothetical protein
LTGLSIDAASFALGALSSGVPLTALWIRKMLRGIKHDRETALLRKRAEVHEEMLATVRNLTKDPYPDTAESADSYDMEKAAQATEKP